MWCVPVGCERSALELGCAGSALVYGSGCGGGGFCGGRCEAGAGVGMGICVSSPAVEDTISIFLAGPLAEARYRRFRIGGIFAPTSQDTAKAWEVATRWEQAKDGAAADA